MKISRRILSAILTLSMLVTVMPMAVGAEADDNYVSIFMADMEGGTTLSSTGLNINSNGTSTRQNAVVNAKDIGIDDEGVYGNVLKYAANATDGTGATDDNYAMITYTRGEPGILGSVIGTDNESKLRNMKASADLYLPSDSLGAFSMRFYDTTYDEPSGTTTGETLVDTSKASDDEGNAYLVAKFINNGKHGSGVALPTDTWFSLEYVFDFDADTYDVYIGGEQVVSDYALATLVGKLHFNSFRFSMGSSSSDYAFYIDNVAAYYNDVDLAVDRDVYESEYNLNLFTADLTAKSLSDAGISAGSDAKPDCGIVSAADFGIADNGAHDKIVKFGKLADESNKNAYFMISATTGSYKPLTAWAMYKNLLQNTELTFDMYLPSATSKDFSLQLYDRGTGDGVGGTQAHSEYIGYFTRNVDESNNVTFSAKFTNGGKQQENSVVIPTDDWFTVSVRCDFANDTYDVYVDGELVVDDFAFVQPTKDASGKYGTNGMGADYIMNSMALRVGSTTDAFAMYIDNVEINAIDPYSLVIAEMNFDELAVGTILSETNNPDNKYFFTSGVTAEIKKDDVTGSNIAVLNQAKNATSVFGLNQNVTYDRILGEDGFGYAEYPEKIKISFNMKKALSSTAMYCYMGGTTYSNNDEIMIFSGTIGKYCKRAIESKTNTAVGAWKKVVLYMDFATKKCTVYENDTFVGVADLPEKATTPEYIAFATNGAANNACIDNVKICALTPYAAKSNIINYIEYTADSTGAFNGDVAKTGYILSNAAASEMTYKILEGKYSVDDDSLVDVLLLNESVAAKSLELKNLPVKTATEDYYYQYFVWSDVDDTITPLFENVIIK